MKCLRNAAQHQAARVTVYHRQNYSSEGTLAITNPSPRPHKPHAPFLPRQHSQKSNFLSVTLSARTHDVGRYLKHERSPKQSTDLDAREGGKCYHYVQNIERISHKAPARVQGYLSLRLEGTSCRSGSLNAPKQVVVD